MRSAEDTFGWEMGGVKLQLRPSLRCACRLERRYGFEPLARAIADGNLTVMTDMIIEASVDDDLDRHMIEAALACNLRHLDYISGQLLAFIFTMCGGDDDAPDDDASPSSHRPLPLAEFYAKLYRIGTGWLGWTPADTWHSTPTEIVEAYRGRTELLQAIFGAPGSDDQDGNFKPDLDAKLDRDGLDSLKSLGRL